MIIASTVPDLIILDIMLPGMSGGEVLQRLKKASDTQTIPVIIVTASQEAQETLVWQVGSANTFSKPFDTETIVDRVEAILGKQL
jgi:DNA-binding response OmpR family regulator